MFKTQHIIRSGLFLLLALLAGCTQHKPSYNLKPLQPRTAYDQVTKKTEHGDVTVRCATCSYKDIHAIFGKDGNVLFNKQNGNRIIPVQLYIENNSSYTWSLSPYDIRLPLADIQDVKDRFIYGATARGLTSFTLTGGCGIILTGLGAAASIFHPILGASIMGAGCSMVLIAPIRSHNKTASISSQNIQFAHVLDTISLQENLVIHPHEQVNKLIFVEHKPIRDDFLLRLCNRDNPDHTIAYNLYFEKDIRKS